MSIFLVIFAVKMSQELISLCSIILKEHYGDVVERVGCSLAKKGSLPIKLLSDDTNLKIAQVIHVVICCQPLFFKL